jgi:hypothetical protein
VITARGDHTIRLAKVVTWHEWRKYPLFFTLLWWGLMSVVLFIEVLQLLLIRGGELP